MSTRNIGDVNVTDDAISTGAQGSDDIAFGDLLMIHVIEKADRGIVNSIEYYSINQSPASLVMAAANGAPSGNGPDRSRRREPPTRYRYRSHDAAGLGMNPNESATTAAGTFDCALVVGFTEFVADDRAVARYVAIRATPKQRPDERLSDLSPQAIPLSSRSSLD